MFPGEMLLCHRGCSKKMLVLAREIFTFLYKVLVFSRDKKVPEKIVYFGDLCLCTPSTIGWWSGEMLGFSTEMPVCCMEKPGYPQEVLVCLRGMLV